MFAAARIPSAQKWSGGGAGQHIEFGIAEHNLFPMLAAAGLAGPLFGTRLLPIGTVYDPFIARGLDALNYAAYMDSRFLLVATPSGVTLGPEGGAHQSIATLLIGMRQPALASYEPAFADELAVLLEDAFARMQAADGGSTYLRLTTRAIAQPERTDDRWRAGTLAGGYWLRPPAPGAEARPRDRRPGHGRPGDAARPARSRRAGDRRRRRRARLRRRGGGRRARAGDRDRRGPERPLPSMAAATGRWSEGVPGGATIAEGIAVAVPGRRTRAHVEALVDDVVVGEDRIETAITLLFQIEKTLTEGAGAAGLAAVLADPTRCRGRRVGLILCGGNIDTVVQDRSFLASDAKSARVEVEVELADPLLRVAMERALGEQGFVVEGGR